MGKLTISMANFHSYVTNDQRVDTWNTSTERYVLYFKPIIRKSWVHVYWHFIGQVGNKKNRQLTKIWETKQFMAIQPSMCWIILNNVWYIFKKHTHTQAILWFVWGWPHGYKGPVSARTCPRGLEQLSCHDMTGYLKTRAATRNIRLNGNIIFHSSPLSKYTIWAFSGTCHEFIIESSGVELNIEWIHHKTTERFAADPPARQNHLVQLVQAKQLLREVRRKCPVGLRGFSSLDLQRRNCWDRKST